ncbi:MAG: patatin-like phospholipase family protein [Rhodomicrobium sp.]
MAGPEPYLELLAAIPAFAGLNRTQLQTLYGFTSLKVLAKGEAAAIAGADVPELAIVVSGRVVRSESGGAEAGRGTAIEGRAFFTRQPAQTTAIALRETVFLTLAWDDLTDALCAHQKLLAGLFSRLGNDCSPLRPPKPSRLVTCPAGGEVRLAAHIQDALLAGFESMAEVRLLSSKSFGGALPGAITLSTPETAQWLQEQELQFDLTVTIAEEANPAFTRQVIEEADEIVFVATGAEARLSAFEDHAISVRGGANCHLLVAAGRPAAKNFRGWLSGRHYHSAKVVDFASPEAMTIVCAGILGKGTAVAATSCGVYAAAILGALQALGRTENRVVSLAAAGSAILPAGIFAYGGSFADVEAIFDELADPILWRRASRPEASLYDAAPLDRYLQRTLRGLESSSAPRPFAAASYSLSGGSAHIHEAGGLYEAVRAGLAPPGILPPFILEDGTILVSGETQDQALLAAAGTLNASPVLYFFIQAPPMSVSTTSYSALNGRSGLSPFQAQKTIDKRLRLETVISARKGSPSVSGARAFGIPIPKGITPMDWPSWRTLRDAAYEWTAHELTLTMTKEPEGSS